LQKARKCDLMVIIMELRKEATTMHLAPMNMVELRLEMKTKAVNALRAMTLLLLPVIIYNQALCAMAFIRIGYHATTERGLLVI
jgi:hypothetical protein